jgi:hypothetical protein
MAVTKIKPRRITHRIASFFMFWPPNTMVLLVFCSIALSSILKGHTLADTSIYDGLFFNGKNPKIEKLIAVVFA